jgi:hypothetical protein
MIDIEQFQSAINYIAAAAGIHWARSAFYA